VYISNVMRYFSLRVFLFCFWFAVQVCSRQHHPYGFIFLVV